MDDPSLLFATPLRPGRRKAVRALAGSLALGIGVSPAGRAFAAQTQSRREELSAYAEIVLSVAADYVLAAAAKPFIRITAEPKVLALIGTEVSAGRLRVIAKESFNTQQPVNIEIGFVTLQSLTVDAPLDLSLKGLQTRQFKVSAQAPADIELSGLNLSTLALDIEGSATIRASGRAQVQRHRIRGTGTILAAGLDGDEAELDIEGAGDAEVNVRQSLDARIQGSASVRYGGHPRLSQHIEGSGSIERM